VLEHGRAVTGQMLNELDGAALGPADQLFEPFLPLDQGNAYPVVERLNELAILVPNSLASSAAAFS
jgi:hypothetical protein